MKRFSEDETDSEESSEGENYKYEKVRKGREISSLPPRYLLKNRVKRDNSTSPRKVQKSSEKPEPKIVNKLLLIPVCILIVYIANCAVPTSRSNLRDDVDGLKKQFPSQKSEIWYEILKMLDTESNSEGSKSIILLYDNDRKTCDCFLNKLILIFCKNSFKLENVTFTENFKYNYGEVLQHYMSIVEKYRLLVTDLNKISWNSARIFHPLHDLTFQDKKPSAFFFTLKDMPTVSTAQKPGEKVHQLLRDAWKELPENEFYPLLSRISKSVIEILPEKEIHCSH